MTRKTFRRFSSAKKRLYCLPVALRFYKGPFSGILADHQPGLHAACYSKLAEKVQSFHTVLPAFFRARHLVFGKYYAVLVSAEYAFVFLLEKYVEAIEVFNTLLE